MLLPRWRLRVPDDRAQPRRRALVGAKDPRTTPAHLPATCPLWLSTSRVQEEGRRTLGFWNQLGPRVLGNEKRLGRDGREEQQGR